MRRISYKLGDGLCERASEPLEKCPRKCKMIGYAKPPFFVSWYCFANDRMYGSSGSSEEFLRNDPCCPARHPGSQRAVSLSIRPARTAPRRRRLFLARITTEAQRFTEKNGVCSMKVVVSRPEGAQYLAQGKAYSPPLWDSMHANHLAALKGLSFYTSHLACFSHILYYSSSL